MAIASNVKIDKLILALGFNRLLSYSAKDDRRSVLRLTHPTSEVGWAIGIFKCAILSAMGLVQN